MRLDWYRIFSRVATGVIVGLTFAAIHWLRRNA